MTPSAPDQLRPWLAELTAALISLDHTAVDTCSSKLEELAPRLIREQKALVAAQMAELRSSVRLARTLSLHASRLYHGWARIAAFQGSAYTPAGNEPAPAAAGAVVFEA